MSGSSMKRRSRPSADKAVLDLLARLARVVGAMTQESIWHDQMFDIMADIEALQIALKGTGLISSVTN